MKRGGGKLSSQHGELNALSNLINCGALLLDGDKELRFASPNAYQLLGFESENAIRNGWEKVLSWFELSRLDTLKAGGEPLRFRAECPLSGSMRLLRLEAYRLESGGRGSFLVLLKDRQLLDNLNRQLLLASQIGIQAYVANSLVHDLNGPINNIQLTLELLRSSLNELTSSLPNEVFQRLQRYQSVLKEETHRLSSLIKALPSSLNPPSLKPEQFDVREVVEEVMGRLRHEAAAKQIRRTIMTPPYEVTITGSPDHIKLALFNLAIMLVEATSTGGNLLLKAERRAHVAEITLCSDAAHMAEESFNELHQLFFSSSCTSSNRHSLGLFAARLVIESHGGDLAFETKSSHEVVFRALLPLTAAAHRANPTPDAVNKEANY